MLMLIAGPYFSGTGGNSARVAAHRARLEARAGPIVDRSHLPLLGDWMALPIIHEAGWFHHGVAGVNVHQYPFAQRVLERCAAVPRVSGEYRGLDLDVTKAHEIGISVYATVEASSLRQAGSR